MGIGEDFSTFCGKLAVPNRSSISDRYEQITRRFNLEFWNSGSRVNHSIYTGSYGRNTATGATSDVDMIFWLPVSLGDGPPYLRLYAIAPNDLMATGWRSVFS